MEATYLELGYDVLVLNYRGNTGLGRAVLEGQRGGLRGGMQRDILAGIDAAYRQNFIRHDKPLYLIADSFGALLGLDLMSEHPDLFERATLISPLLDLDSFLDTRKEAESSRQTIDAITSWSEQIPGGTTDIANFGCRNHSAWTGPPIVIVQAADDEKLKMSDAECLADQGGRNKVRLSAPVRGGHTPSPDKMIEWIAAAESYSDQLIPDGHGSYIFPEESTAR